MDIDFTLLPDNSIDWYIANGDLAIGHDLQSAVLLSLFSDGVASLDFNPPDGSQDRRGWWGDTYELIGTGSLLWTFDRRKISNKIALLLEARDIVRKALQWLLDEGIADKINVATAYSDTNAISISIELVKPDATKVAYRFSWAWA